MNASFSFTFLFLLLPAPLKVALVILGGFWFTAGNVRKVEQAQAADAVGRAPAVKIAEPEVAERAVPAKKADVIILQADGTYMFGGEKLTQAQFVKKLKTMAKVDPKRRVVLQADATLPHQKVVGAMKLCQDAGLSNIAFQIRK